MTLKFPLPLQSPALAWGRQGWAHLRLSATKRRCLQLGLRGWACRGGRAWPGLEGAASSDPSGPSPGQAVPREGGARSTGRRVAGTEGGITRRDGEGQVQYRDWISKGLRLPPRSEEKTERFTFQGARTCGMRRSPPRVLEQGATSSLGQRPRRASPWFQCQDGFLPRFLRTACPHPSASPCQCRPLPRAPPGAGDARSACQVQEPGNPGI